MTPKEELLLRSSWEIVRERGKLCSTASIVSIAVAVQRVTKQIPALASHEEYAKKVLAEFWGVTPEDGLHIGDRIRLRRESLGFSQARLSSESHVKQQTISQIESGKLSNPTVDTLSGISRALGVTLDALYHGTY